MSSSPCERRPRLENARLLVVKIGSAVLTNAGGLDVSILSSLARQLAALHNVDGRRLIVVSSGAVAAGRAVMAGHALPPPSRTVKQALAAMGQGRLVQAWNDAFAACGVTTAQILLTRDDFRIRERFQHAGNTFSELLAWGVVPIVNENDTVAVDELQFGDNDCLASLIVNLVQADLFVNLTSAPGVFAENPQKNPDASILSCIPDIAGLNLDELCGEKTSVGSGGMYSKLLAARRVAQLGVPTLILPGRKENVLTCAFSEDGSNIGTWVAAAENAIPRRKFWLAYQSLPKGSLYLDAGARDALARDGRSLLPGGIVRLDGDFAAGDLVRVLHGDHLLGVGFTNYGATELGKIIGKKRHEIAAILGNAKYPDVIHRDNLLLDAAL